MKAVCWTAPQPLLMVRTHLLQMARAHQLTAWQPQVWMRDHPQMAMPPSLVVVKTASLQPLVAVTTAAVQPRVTVTPASLHLLVVARALHHLHSRMKPIHLGQGPRSP